LKVLVTGSSGLIGSEAVVHFDAAGHSVIGVDNNMRMEFFGEAGDTSWNLERLRRATKHFQHHAIDIRDREGVMALFRRERPELVIHCAAQPSHDKAKEIPLIDFDVNAGGTLNLLEAMRQNVPQAVFVHMSTNKVYGDAPNELPLAESETRYDYARPEDVHGISEECRVDRSTHSVMGASKLAADVMAQEYGRYFGLKVGVFRGGCLTGPSHSGVELHGFLSYLVHVAVHGKPYTIYGYKGKQVRDQIHSHDVIRAFESFARNPRPGEVYNLGGGRENAASVLESIALIKELTGHAVEWSYKDQNRIGDHICYISDLRKLKSHYPEWRITRALPAIIQEMVRSEEARIHPQRRAPAES
jgi:CDP-paratose 2-epimerase